jgi:hypothetical protein
MRGDAHVNDVVKMCCFIFARPPPQQQLAAQGKKETGETSQLSLYNTVGSKENRRITKDVVLVLPILRGGWFQDLKIQREKNLPHTFTLAQLYLP